MITATVGITTTSTSLYNLINTAIPGKLTFNGRVCEIQIHWLTGTFFLFDIPGVFGVGSGPTAVNEGYQFSDPATDGGTGETILIMRVGGLNGLSLMDAYLGTAAGAGTARILAYSV